MVSRTLAVPPDNKVTLTGFNDNDGLELPPGDTEHVILTSPEKPPTLVNVIAVLPEDPRVTLIADCSTCNWKSGGDGGTICRTTTTV
jgi:hypothetical protein